jgi:outer membrane protein insertion porin family
VRLVRKLAALAMTAACLLSPLAAQTPANPAQGLRPPSSTGISDSPVQASPAGDNGYDLPSYANPATSLGAIYGYQGRVVHDIRFKGIESDEKNQLLSLLAQKANEPLDRTKIRQSLQDLNATGRFSEVLVEAELRPDNQVSLVFIASQNYFVNFVTVDGAPKRPNEYQLVNVTKLQLGQLYREEDLAASLDRMTALLKENGYYRSTLKVQKVYQPKTQLVDFHFKLSAGEPATVGEIKLEGDAGRPLEEVLQSAKIHPGDVVTYDRVNNALQRLRKRFQKRNRVEARVLISKTTYRPDQNKVDYVFSIDRGPLVLVHVDGVKLTRRTIRKYVPVYEENSVDSDLLNEGRSNLRDYLETRGYFDAKVGYKRENGPNQIVITYVVDRGMLHKLSEVVITGNKYFPAEVIRERMQVQPAGRLLSRGLFSQSLISRDMTAIEELYRANGFLKIKVTNKVNDDYQGQVGRMAVFVYIDEGPQTRVAQLKIEGNTKISDAEIGTLVTNSEGQPYSDRNVNSDRTSILNAYFNRGFPNATFEAEAKPVNPDGTLMDVTYTIHEGEQFFVDQVLVSGLNYTKPFVVEQQLQIHPEDPLSQEQMVNSQAKLYDLGIFNEVDTAVENPDGAEKDKNVLFQTREAKRYTFEYGIGFEAQTGSPQGTTNPQGATSASPRVTFNITRLNFRGRAHTITFRSHIGGIEKLALVSYDAPRLFDRDNLRLTVTGLYDNAIDVQTFTSERLEGAVQLEQIMSKTTTLLYRMTYRRVRATNFAPNVDPALIPLFNQPVRVGMPGFTYIRDNRDNPIESTKGSYSSLDLGLAAGFFGSQASFSRYIAQNSTYHSFKKKKYVFARSTRIGVENIFGNSAVVPFPERFFSGGGNSLRGFGLNQAGPRDLLSGLPLGGNAVFVNNFELRFPPVYLPFFENNLSFVAFHDMGNVFDTGHDMLHSFTRWSQKNVSDCRSLVSTGSTCNFNYMSQAVGGGIRYKTPVGPVRLDLGYNLNPPVFPIRAGNPPSVQVLHHFNFYFSIGQTF